MNYKEIKIWEDTDNEAFLKCYILDTKEFHEEKKKPAVIICPGGGYLRTAERESEPVAIKFASYGYQVFVLKYNVYFGNKERPDLKNLPQPNEKSVYPQPLFDLAMAIRIIRNNAEEWFIDEDKIVLCGFSAGGNLVANMGVKWHEKFISEKLNVASEHFKPNVLILSYPITDYTLMKKEFEKNPKEDLKEFWDMSNKAIFGKENPNEKELIDLSPTLHVSQDTPPTFIWHTANDSLVYSINSIMFGKALYEQDIPFELHIFEDGPHGLSLCDETSAGKEEHINHRCKKWFEMAIDFLNNQFNKKQ